LNEEDKVALQNEIDILTQVDHPNIVKLYEVFEDEKFYALVMELMTGGEVSIAYPLSHTHTIVVRHHPREGVLQ
jgi:serine/threonine protein kinase